MNFIENIKSKIEDYKQYKNPRYSRALILQKSKNRNLFNYIQMKRFEKKYADALYRHFKVMNDIHSYELLINLFGKKNIEKAFANKNATTSEIADKLFKAGNIEISNEMQDNYVLKKMMNCIAFNRTTSLNLSDLQLGINPETFERQT